MSDRTQDIKNLRAVATACKNYTDKKIEDLRWELGTYDLGVESDNTSALVKTMPSGTIKANVNKIYGASEVSENLIVLNDVVETTTNGITYKIDSATGTITMNGTATTGVDLRFYYASINFLGDYAMALFFNKNVTFASIGLVAYNKFTAIENTNYYGGTKNWSSSFTANYGFIRFTEGQILDNVTMKLMIIKGTTEPTEFKVGFTGIHNLELSGLKVEGVNLFDNANTPLVNSTFNASNQTLFSYGGFALKVFNLTIGQTYTITSTKTMLLGETNDLTNSGTVSNGTSYTFTATTTYLLITNYVANEYTDMFANIMLNYGSTALDYVPYITPITKTIDLSTILYNGSPLFEGNSLKAVGTAKDYITPYKAHKQMGYVNLGELNYTKSLSGLFQTNAFYNMKPASSTFVPQDDKILSSIYEVIDSNSISGPDGESPSPNMVMAYSPSNVLYFNNTSYTTVEAFKNAMSGVYLVYELATPIEVSIDWSATLRNIQGYPNGSITAQNTYDMATTSEIDYLVEEVKA